MKSLIFSLICILSTLLSNNSLAQDVVFDEEEKAREMVLEQNIKSIKLYNAAWENSYPIMVFNEGHALTLEFDDLSTSMEDYSYLVIHCDADWRQSDLMDNEYMEGYFENQIRDAESSFNTYYSYYHYKLVLPNEDIQLTRSGNYLLVVFRGYDKEDVVFTRRFMISESKVSILADVHRPVLTSYRDNSHEVDLTIEHSQYNIDDPYGQTTLSIFQNGVWDYGITGLKPLFMNPGELVYDYQEENIFPAGNEFRMFNTVTTMVRGYHIKDINYMEYFHFELNDDEANPAYLYFENEDMNGRYFINSADGQEPALDADYVFVHFTLKMPFPLADGDVYIAGELSNWQFSERNKMQYDASISAYRCSMLLKQGIYNYRYMFLPNNKDSFDVSEIEGSHYETENEYLILFYHRKLGDRYDRLVGHHVAHSKQ